MPVFDGVRSGRNLIDLKITHRIRNGKKDSQFQIRMHQLWTSHEVGHHPSFSFELINQAGARLGNGETVVLAESASTL
jgi:hypothetical protein